MNLLKGKISGVKVNGELSLVSIQVGEFRFSSIVIDTPKTSSYLQLEHPVKIIFKETEVIMATGKVHPISLQNRIPGTIFSIESDNLLSKVVLNSTIGKITSIITTNAVNQLELEVGKEAIAMIKTNELMLSK